MSAPASTSPRRRPAAADDASRWAAVRARDARFDGRFVYAVTSTGIFCRPSCPSRRPRRAHVRFFDDGAQAAAAGFRPCRRCRPDSPGPAPAVDLVQRAIAAIEAAERPPSLAALAKTLGASPSHLHKCFRAIVGVTPKAYADQRRRTRFKAALRAGEPIAGALYDAGYGAPSRVYEHRAAGLGMTPATYARGGRGADITYAILDSPFDRLLVAATRRGLCAVFLGDDDAVLARELAREFPAARLSRDDNGLRELAADLLGCVAGTVAHEALALDIRATAFQARVWRALQAIPRGETRSYQALAAAIGQPGAARAVGGACASNPVSLAVPCHRAVRADGGLGGYRWGLKRKRALLDREAGAGDGTKP